MYKKTWIIGHLNQPMSDLGKQGKKEIQYFMFVQYQTGQIVALPACTIVLLCHNT